MFNNLIKTFPYIILLKDRYAEFLMLKPVVKLEVEVSGRRCAAVRVPVLGLLPAASSFPRTLHGGAVYIVFTILLGIESEYFSWWIKILKHLEIS